jgi:hypothetical protein
MPRQNEQDRQAGEAFYAEVLAEAERQGRSLASLSRAVNPRNQNLIADARARGKVPGLPLVLKFGKALGISSADLVVRVERRLQESGQ